MNFINYKDFPLVNLSKVGTITKENQQITKEAAIYAISFYEFERKHAFWVFQNLEERDKIYEAIKNMVSKDLGKSKTQTFNNAFSGKA